MANRRNSKLPIALAISSGFEFLLDILVHLSWMMIVSDLTSVRVGITEAATGGVP